MSETTAIAENDRARTLDRVRAPGRPTRRAWIIAGVAVLAAAAGGYLLVQVGARPPAATAEPIPVLTVTTATPQRVTWPVTLVASGTIAPWQEASVGAQIGSYQLVEVRADVGDHVRRGQVLARLNPALLRAEEAQLLARHDQAVANQHRAAGLQANGAISDQELLQAATEAKQAAALLAAKRLELRYTEILAPDDGVVTARTATLGAVAPEGQELFRMIRRNRLEWRGEVTAAQLRSVAIGQTISLALPDGSAAEAMVRQTSPSLDGASRLALVYADLAPGSRARAGMYAEGRIVAGVASALTIPADCVVLRDGRSHVMVLDDASAPPTVRRRVVTIGRRSGGAVEILNGLTGRERLVQRGAGFLDDGDAVRVAGRTEARR
ncbi:MULTISPECIES: efflux RND transporter periplasmic adaptor subunit [unclassified Phenylobacterium]|uniref:efflux RND transporter periplasmic adaptor subunit n=1 Tax=unclassified Phenylobacterium TaxID=2640670 RepID=UPI0009E8CAE5|nr:MULTISPECIES: efflux RND transporter periplasmic adaptor subunit [unclassified Phenylobacterium]